MGRDQRCGNQGRRGDAAEALTLVLAGLQAHIDLMTNLPALRAPDFDAEIAALARDYVRANGPVMALVNKIGGGVERQIAALPARMRAEVERVSEGALRAAMAAGAKMPNLGRRGAMAAAVASGAVGGAGGLLSSVAELPVTISVILQGIQQEARAAGFDPEQASIKAACIQVFAAGTPLAQDDGLNAGFVSARLTLSGPALQKLIEAVAPKLALAMGQKLAAQAVPVLGALSGAALNAAYLTYYREMARIRFALMRLSVRHGAEDVVSAFAVAVSPPRLTKA